MDVSSISNAQAQYASAAAKPTPVEISLNTPPSEATQHSNADQEQLRSFQFTNDKNIERERAIHEQVKAQLLKDGYTTKAALVSQTYSSRSDKGRALLGS